MADGERGKGRKPTADLTSAVLRLAGEFPHVPVGRVLSMVYRCIRDLHKVALARELPASPEEILEVATSMVRRRLLRREPPAAEPYPTATDRASVRTS